MPCRHILILILFGWGVLSSGQATVQASVPFHLQKAQIQLENSNLFGALKEYRLALTGDPADPGVIHEKIAGICYLLGFMDQALNHTESALEHAPEADYLHHRLGVLHFVQKINELAKESFIRALKINPGCANTHYYLSLVFERQGFTKAASMFAAAASQLGHQASFENSYPDSELDSVWLNDPDTIYLRKLTLNDRHATEVLLDRVRNGALFEQIATQEYNSTSGGYIGGFPHEDLQDWAVTSMAETDTIPGPPMVVGADDSFSLVQRLAPVDWEKIAPLFGDSSTAIPSASTPTETQEAVIEPEPDQVASRSGNPQDNRASLSTEKKYGVQIGAFRNRTNADALIKRAEKSGFNAILVKRQLNGMPWYETFEGYYSALEEAQKRVQELNRSGIDAFIRRL